MKFIYKKCNLKQNEHTLKCHYRYFTKCSNSYRYLVIAGLTMLIIAAPLQFIISYWLPSESFIDRMGSVALVFFTIAEMIFSKQYQSQVQGIQEHRLNAIQDRFKEIKFTQIKLITHSITSTAYVKMITNALIGKKNNIDTKNFEKRYHDENKKLLSMLDKIAQSQKELEQFIAPIKDFVSRQKDGESTEDIVNSMDESKKDRIESYPLIIDMMCEQKNKFGQINIQQLMEEVKLYSKEIILKRENFLHVFHVLLIITATLFWGFGSLIIF